MPLVHSVSARSSGSSFTGLGAKLGERVAPDDGGVDDERPTRITIRMQARGLANMDKRSEGKSDPYVIVHRASDVTNVSTGPAGAVVSGEREWEKIGQTETVFNNLNPNWATPVLLEYKFSSVSLLRFRIYDRDDNTTEDVSKQDFLGEVACTVAQLVLAQNQRLELQVKNTNLKVGSRTGTFTVHAEEEKSDLGECVTIQFASSDLRKAKKPFYVLSRANKGNDSYSTIHYSEVHRSFVHGRRNEFKPLSISLAKLVNGEMERSLQIEFWDYDRKGNHRRGGRATFTLKSLQAATSGGTAGERKSLRLQKRKTNQSLVHAGTLEVSNFDISNPVTFLNYISSGVAINTVIAMDMSSTNGNPQDPLSLQYNNRYSANEYVIALREVGRVLAEYDTTKRFSALGFSARLPPYFSELSDCFALTGDFQHPECDSIEGVVRAYHHSLDAVAPHGPCKYAPMLQHVIRIAAELEQSTNSSTYTVLLLLTDGDFSDFAQTANTICNAAELPLSIVIVGVGNSDMVLLDKLDGDTEPLCNTEGVPCTRDIVQFVPFHRHRHNPAALAREVLDEIPDQLLSYMRSKGIRPGDISRRQPQPAVLPELQTAGQEQGPFMPRPSQVHWNIQMPMQMQHGVLPHGMPMAMPMQSPHGMPMQQRPAQQQPMQQQPMQQQPMQQQPMQQQPMQQQPMQQQPMQQQPMQQHTGMQMPPSSGMPMQQPTSMPMPPPSGMPMQQPTSMPMQQPTSLPMQQPTSLPMQQPTSIPTQQPTSPPMQHSPQAQAMPAPYSSPAGDAFAQPTILVAPPHLAPMYTYTCTSPGAGGEGFPGASLGAAPGMQPPNLFNSQNLASAVSGMPAMTVNLPPELLNHSQFFSQFPISGGGMYSAQNGGRAGFPTRSMERKPAAAEQSGQREAA